MNFLKSLWTLGPECYPTMFVWEDQICPSSFDLQHLLWEQHPALVVAEIKETEHTVGTVRQLVLANQSLVKSLL